MAAEAKPEGIEALQEELEAKKDETEAKFSDTEAAVVVAQENDTIPKKRSLDEISVSEKELKEFEGSESKRLKVEEKAPAEIESKDQILSKEKPEIEIQKVEVATVEEVDKKDDNQTVTETSEAEPKPEVAEIE